MDAKGRGERVYIAELNQAIISGNFVGLLVALHGRWWGNCTGHYLLTCVSPLIGDHYTDRYWFYILLILTFNFPVFTSHRKEFDTSIFVSSKWINNKNIINNDDTSTPNPCIQKKNNCHVSETHSFVHSTNTPSSFPS